MSTKYQTELKELQEKIDNLKDKIEEDKQEEQESKWVQATQEHVGSNVRYRDHDKQDWEHGVLLDAGFDDAYNFLIKCEDTTVVEFKCCQVMEHLAKEGEIIPPDDSDIGKIVAVIHEDGDIYGFRTFLGKGCVLNTAAGVPKTYPLTYCRPRKLWPSERAVLKSLYKYEN